MPTYEYVCDACEHEFEQFQSITAPVRRKCPECGKNQLRRKIGVGAAVIFKGSGFYQTDYRSERYKKDAQADKPKTESSKSDSRSASGKTESTSKSSDA